MRIRNRILWFFGITAMYLQFVKCDSNSSNYTFEYLSSSETHIDFSNNIQTNDTFNVLDFHYIYNGGGVGAGDFNNDGLIDLVFTGNQTASKIYLNQGNFTFQDITSASQFNTKGWNTGVSIVDINADGLLDIYISTGGNNCKNDCDNQFFIHQGLDEKGIPQFKEMASDYGLLDGAYTQQAAFFDYDADGDLDVYLLHNLITSKDKNRPIPRKMLPKQSADRLLRNDSESGKIQFTDVTLEANITHPGFGLGIAINDINRDGLPDIYIANDFITEDVLYINNGLAENGQHLGFTEKSKSLLNHITYNSMGVDISDANNDALPDIMVVDMMPDYHERQKTMLGFMNYNKFNIGQERNYTPQFVRNTLQVHNGFLNDTTLTYSELGYLADIHSTDWSWSPLFGDLDNDGDNDLLITNGYVKDITDLDFVSYNANDIFGSPEAKKKRSLEMIAQMKGIKLDNYVFENKGEFEFKNQQKQWIAPKSSYSNGAVLVDLNNDGALDIVTNNIDDEAFIIKNKGPKQNYININLQGSDKNPNAFGALVTIWHKGNAQAQYHYASRGYLSSKVAPLHFGLDTIDVIDSIVVQWTNNTNTTLTNLSVNQSITITKEITKPSQKKSLKRAKNFKKISPIIAHQHQENRHTDFDVQSLLLKQYDAQGPCIAIADIDNQNGQDIFIGGARGFAGQLYTQSNDGTFTVQSLENEKSEDTNGHFFDADGDGDLDLYVTSGSSEVRYETPYYQDRLYINNNGQFTLNSDALPKMWESTSSVVSIDYDNDGDLDLFVGGKITPHKYPKIPNSYLLENNNGIFTDITPKSIQKIGMVSHGVAEDIDGDDQLEIIVGGEWMPITIIQFKDDIIVETIPNSEGLWNKLALADLDNDGDLDIIGANQGCNSRLQIRDDQPLLLNTEDIDNNGMLDPLVGQVQENKAGDYGIYPYHSRDDVIKQIPKIKQRFVKYADFSKATFEDILGTEAYNKTLKVKTLKTGIFINDGNGTFTFQSLPTEAQTSVVQDISIHDFNADGTLDILMVGNDWRTEINGGWQNAFTGLLLLGNGRGEFKCQKSSESGFYINEDSRFIEIFQLNTGEQILLHGSNNGPITCFAIENELN